MDNVCRLCLQSQEKMIPIFSKDNATVNLKSQIKDYCSIQISEDDILPKSICTECGVKLYSIYKFREQCKTSEQRLHEYYKIREQKSSVQTSEQIEVPTNNRISTNEINDETVQNKQPALNISVKCSKKDKKCIISSEKATDLPVAQEIDEVYLDAEDSSTENYKSADECSVDHNVECINRSKKTRIQRREKRTCKRLVCNICQKTYMTKEALLKHTTTHTEKALLTCELCNITFENKVKLSRHKRKHTDIKIFKCEVCSMPFKEAYKLKRHLRMHGKGKPINNKKTYVCDMCSRTFVTKSGLLLHIKMHNGLKPFKCKFCSKEFFTISYKKRHERVHAGTKDFVCHICSASFASSSGLKYHLLNHTGETKFNCKTCGKAFTRKKYLEEHTYTHTGERPFACKICGSAYGSSGSLYVHFRKCKTQSNVNSNSSVAQKKQILID